MDPFSIISGVAGIATAGTTLVSSLYTLVQTVRHAPRQMRDVAKEMTNLTCVLEHLHEIISDGHEIATPQYLRGIKTIVQSIKETQDEILDMIDDQSIVRRLKWSRAKPLIADIQAHKSTVSMQVVILTLGIVKKNATHKMKSSERRLRRQAESLVQASQDCLGNLKETADMTSAGWAPPPPPPTAPERDATDPFVDGVYRRVGQPQSLPPKPEYEDEVSSKMPNPLKAVLTSRPSIGHLPATNNGTAPSMSNDRRPVYETARKHTLTSYNQSTRRDAATLLYNLVFLSTTEDSGYESNEADFGDDMHSYSSEASFGIEEILSSDEDAAETPRRNRRTTGHKVTKQGRKHTQNKSEGANRQNETYQEGLGRPSGVVNRLLLEWTSLSSEEVKGGEEEQMDSKDDEREETLRGKVQAIAADSFEPEIPQRSRTPDSFYESDYVPRYPPPPRSSSPWDEEVPGAQQRGPAPHYVPRREPPRHGYAMPPPPSAGVPRSGYPYADYDYPLGYDPFRPAPRRGFQDEDWQTPRYRPHATGGVRFAEDGFRSSPYAYDYEAQSGGLGANEGGPLGYQSFESPNVLVVGRACDLSEGKNAQSPKLDILSKGFRLERQRANAPDIWNSLQFSQTFQVRGRAIMGALASDKSNGFTSDLLGTLSGGYNLPTVYIRGSDLGETWFLDTAPVFILFYHSSYQPQFFPPSEEDEKARSREYLAIGEEWVCDEALTQLGIVPRGKFNGRVVLEPLVTRAELLGLVRLSQDLKWVGQRRKYGKTFYQPLETFRAIHSSPPAGSSSTAAIPETQHSVVSDPPSTPVGADESTVPSVHIPENLVKDQPRASMPRMGQEPQHNPAEPPPPPSISPVFDETRQPERRRTRDTKGARDGDLGDRSHTQSERRRSTRGETSRSHTSSTPDVEHEGHRRRRRHRERRREEDEQSHTAVESGIGSVFSFMRGRT